MEFTRLGHVPTTDEDLPVWMEMAKDQVHEPRSMVLSHFMREHRGVKYMDLGTEWRLEPNQHLGRGALSGCCPNIYIPEGTTFGNQVFTRGSTVTHVKFHGSIQSIPEKLFEFCDTLQSIEGVGITEVGRLAFFFNSRLREVILPKAETIGFMAFSTCAQLVKIRLPAVHTLSRKAFSNCALLRGVDLPEVHSILDECFQNCTTLYEVNAPRVRVIGDNVFENCPSLLHVPHVPHY
jgi:hypothetical protein